MGGSIEVASSTKSRFGDNGASEVGFRREFFYSRVNEFCSADGIIIYYECEHSRPIMTSGIFARCETDHALRYIKSSERTVGGANPFTLDTKIVLPLKIKYEFKVNATIRYQQFFIRPRCGLTLDMRRTLYPAFPLYLPQFLKQCARDLRLSTGSIYNGMLAYLWPSSVD